MLLRLRPSRLLFRLALAWLALGLAASFWPLLTRLWQGAGLALLLLALLDLLLARRQPTPALERQCAGVWPVGRHGPVSLLFRHDGQRPLALQVFDHYPQGWQQQGLPQRLDLAPGAGQGFVYQLTPDRRGNARFGPAQLRLRSPLACWWQDREAGIAQEVKVFPDYSRLLGRNLLATGRVISSNGLIRKRRRGEGTDFRQLREFREGDSQRSIDWKATARTRKLISREYQEERDQQVVFLLDSGRRMLAEDDGARHFDHALNALMTLAFIAQKQGDAIGLLSFGAEQRWLAPQKGRAGLDRLLASLYDLHPQEVAPDYLQAASALATRLQKRAFIVLLTNLRDEDDTAVRAAHDLLAKRHLVICASLRERALDDELQREPEHFSAALRTAAVAEYLQRRRNAIRRMGLDASQLIDVLPAQLSAALTNRYLEIKESGAL